MKPVEPESAPEVYDGLRSYVRQILITGTAIVVPVLLTIFVLMAAVNLLSGVLDPLVITLEQSLGLSEPDAILRVLALGTLLTIIVAVGALAENAHTGDHIEHGVDTVMARLPGIGSIYESVNQLSEVVLETDTTSFQEVKLVEYPQEGSYSVAFVTADTPEEISDAAGHERMQTLFMPMGPNPVMGGFIVHVDADRVYDVDMTVEEGITSIVSLGVAVEATEETEEYTKHIDDYER